MRIGVSVVLFRSDLTRLEHVVRSLAKQSLAPHVVRVHVNAADGDEVSSVQHILAAWPRLISEVTSSPGNDGFCAAHNAAVRELLERGCDAVVVHNPDLMLRPDALSELHGAERKLGSTALFGPVLELADPVSLAPTGLVDTLGIRWTRSARHLDAGQREPMPELPRQPRQVAGISGACLYVPRAAFERIVEATGEFFDEDFFAYREDAELGLRAGLLGVPSWLVPTARGLHVRGLRGTERGRDVLIDRLGVRNRFLLAAKYGGARPGGRVGPVIRDGLVVVGTLLHERSSLPGLGEAWRLRRRMRAKGRLVRQIAASRR